MSGAPDSSNPTDAQQGQGAMTVRGAAFLGVGSMVGAGIFALLGEAGAVAGAAVWLSFLIAGIIATLQGYAVAKLGARYPSSGGIVTFLLQGFGKGHITAITSWLLYFAALIVTAMVSVSFGTMVLRISSGSPHHPDGARCWRRRSCSRLR
jgi:amino acid transporter